MINEEKGSSAQGEPNLGKKSNVAQEEEKILEFWNKNNIFGKILERNADSGEFVFYDGPPFATGLPHYGHLLAGTMKDIIPRFQSMLGKHVRRQWGWDCHGLPIENLIEKEIGLETKKDIEEYGVEKFNQAARDSVLRYEKDWSRIVPRSGRWIDMENKYQTMDPEYTESIWWAFKNLYEKDLVSKGYKSMHLCPRCGTTLSNFEVNQGYADITDISVTVKLELVGELRTFILAWTTTPWTLPGNVAAAVNSEIEYVKVSHEESYYILAKERLEEIFKDKEYEIVGEVNPKDLIGKQYKPLFDYYVDADVEGDQNQMFKIYDADYVTTDDGTGIVHLAPAFGDIDMQLAQKHNIPLIQHVGTDGRFKPEVKDFAGLLVKQKSDKENPNAHQSTDIEIIKHLAHSGGLFSKFKVVHSYPHCWRCDTPLLNYASSSWFINVPELKDKLLLENEKINWIPKEVGTGRFGKWLEGARDWAVSRSRYWGAPLPVWECEDCGDRKVFGSAEELSDSLQGTNTFLTMRHGESESNVSGITSTVVTNKDGLTEKGKDQVKAAVEGLKDRGIDLIIASPFQRTKETAEIVHKELDLETEIVFDDRLVEMDAGSFEGKTWNEFEGQYESLSESFYGESKEGESRGDIKRRMGAFLFDINKTHSDKTILFVTHGGLIQTMQIIAKAQSKNALIKSLQDHLHNIENAQVCDIAFKPFTHNRDFDLDFHKPFIDEVKVPCECGTEMTRVPDVFDCWFESGSMPFAQHHYPFENLDVFDPEKDLGFPADYIAEGLDQTRGWFYTLLVLSVGLFGRSSYKNVIVNGLVLAEDGKKMSKRLKNYPEVDYLFDTYGADAARYYMISSPVVHAEDLRFSEKGVDEVVKKIIMRLSNVEAFYRMYADDIEHSPRGKSDNVLDMWIISRLSQLREVVTEGLLKYELDRASRPFMDFIDDLSTWYVRRSRDRFKGADVEDKKKALETTVYVLRETVTLLAPFMPFIAESLFQKVRNENDEISVHMQKWPEMIERNAEVLVDMETTRKAVTSLLEVRAKNNMKVRQPLAKAMLKSTDLANKDEFLAIIADEVNVKDVIVDDSISADVELDLTLTLELEDEGMARDLIRSIQAARKNAGLSPKDEIALSIPATGRGKTILEKFKTEIMETCGLSEVSTVSYDGEGEFGEVEIN